MRYILNIVLLTQNDLLPHLIIFLLMWSSLEAAIFEPASPSFVAGLRLNRDFKIQRRGRQRERKKKPMGLISKTTTSHVHHAFLYISFLFLRDYDVKMPNFAVKGGRKQATTKFYFSV